MEKIDIKNNYSLKNHNTFRTDVYAKEYFEFNQDSQLEYFVNNYPVEEKHFFILGGGSNVLFTKDFDGLVIHPKTEYIEIIEENKDYIIVKVAAGTNWDSFVEWSVKNNYYGIENLSNIPGNVGASAIQNIGAYGTEVSEHITKVAYLDLSDKEYSCLNNFQCEFSYRNSIFKNELKNRAIITSVTYKLKKNGSLNTSYKDVKEHISGFLNPGLKEMREIIIKIRESKLPDYNKIGNAGSFFKNPIIGELNFKRLQEEYPELKFFKENELEYKIAAGWLIDKCGFKGYKHKGAAVHTKQALIITNEDNAKGCDILELANIIKNKVFETFGIMLEPEVVII